MHTQYQRIRIIIEDKAPNNDDYFGDKSVMISVYPQRPGRVNNYGGFAYISHTHLYICTIATYISNIYNISNTSNNSNNSNISNLLYNTSIYYIYIKDTPTPQIGVED